MILFRDHLAATKLPGKARGPQEIPWLGLVRRRRHRKRRGRALRDRVVGRRRHVYEGGRGRENPQGLGLTNNIISSSWEDSAASSRGVGRRPRRARRRSAGPR